MDTRCDRIQCDKKDQEYYDAEYFSCAIVDSVILALQKKLSDRTL